MVYTFIYMMLWEQIQSKVYFEDKISKKELPAICSQVPELCRERNLYYLFVKYGLIIDKYTCEIKRLLAETVYSNMKKHDPCNPGEILLEEYIQAMGLTVDETADAMKVPAWKLSAILLAQKRIDAELAARLALAFGNTAAYWLDLQHQKDMCDADEVYKKLRKQKAVKQLYNAP